MGEARQAPEGGQGRGGAYDAYGNQTSAATGVSASTAYAYDLGDRLTSITPPSASATTLTYDALGRVNTRTLPSATAETYAYVGTSETAWEISAGTALTRAAIAADGSRTALVVNGTPGFTLPDLHGNQVAVAAGDESAIVSAIRYTGFGVVTDSYSAPSGAVASRWRYQGRLDLSPTAEALYAAGARLYSPATAAFTSLDTFLGDVADPLSMNRLRGRIRRPCRRTTGHG